MKGIISTKASRFLIGSRVDVQDIPRVMFPEGRQVFQMVMTVDFPTEAEARTNIAALQERLDQTTRTQRIGQMLPEIPDPMAPFRRPKRK